jgi:hypothetical protein
MDEAMSLEHILERIVPWPTEDFHGLRQELLHSDHLGHSWLTSTQEAPVPAHLSAGYTTWTAQRIDSYYRQLSAASWRSTSESFLRRIAPCSRSRLMGHAP